MNDIRKILEMVSAGKIEARHGNELIEVLQKKKSPPIDKEPDFVFQIHRSGDDRNIFRLRIPLWLLKTGLEIIPELAVVKTEMNFMNMKLQSINWKSIYDIARNGEKGDLLLLELEDGLNTFYTIHVYIE
ncbi:MAG: hypothetical protein JXB60_08455 [Candidatus Cloacimonetes bacterium]|nr:hypothetical protein [Candidatus Cloacimonadota bacterium]